MLAQNDELNNIREIAVGNFIKNMTLNKVNHEVLFLCGYRYKVDDVKQLLSHIRGRRIIKHIEDVENLNELKYQVAEDVHIILIVRYAIPFNIFKKTDSKILIIDVAITGILEKVLSNIRDYPKEIVASNLKHRIYLEQKDFKEYITMPSIELLENLFFIFEQTHHNQFKFTSGSITQVLMHKPIKLEKWLNQMKNHIYYFHEYKILTARLAIVLYRIANLDSTVSEKAIGMYISKLLRITSTQKSSARFSIPQCKVYDLNNTFLNLKSERSDYE